MPTTRPESVKKTFEMCNAKRYHISGQIQSHGHFISLDIEKNIITAVDCNISALLHIEENQVIGSNIDKWFTPQSIDKINFFGLKTLEKEIEGQQLITIELIDTNNKKNKHDAILYASDSFINIEIDTVTGTTGVEKEAPSSFQIESFKKMSHCNKDDEIGFQLCEALLDVTGMQRAYICAFDEDGNGFVPFEVNSGEMPALIHHHFPASDVPEIVRSLYQKNKMRHMPNVDSLPTDIISQAGIGEKMDLTYSYLRQPAQSHLVYQRSLGVIASCSFSIVANGKLWGIAGTHATKPLKLTLQQLIACENLTDSFASNYIGRIEIKTKQDSLQRIQTTYELSAKHHHHLTDILHNRTKAPIDRSFADLLRADDCIVGFDGKNHIIKSLSAKENLALFDELDKRIKASEILHNISISQWNTALLSAAKHVSGILCIRTTSGQTILWTRKELQYEQKWAGDPLQPIQYIDEGNTKMVSPRNSFETWVKTVDGTSENWTQSDLTVAQFLLDILNTICTNDAKK